MKDSTILLQTKPEPYWKQVRDFFLLDGEEIYLNAGTFSAQPKPVLDEVVRFLTWVEANPTRHGSTRFQPELFWRAHEAIAKYINVDAEDLVLHPNVTQALNQVIFGLDWPRGGELLATNQEYGAIVNALREAAHRKGLTFREFAVPTQPRDENELLDAVLAALTPRTAGVLVSHVTTGSGLVFPIHKIATKLREKGIKLLVDGAHAPGLIPLNLRGSDIEFYGGNLHKWFLGPKGTGFLFVSRDAQNQLQPSVVGWGGTPRDGEHIHDASPLMKRRFHYAFRMQGLRDFAPFFALPSVLKFRESVGTEQVIHQRIAQLCLYLRDRLAGDLGYEYLSDTPPCQAGLVTFRAPPAWSDAKAEERLYREHRITVPMWRHAQLGPIMRLSPGLWTSLAEIDRFVEVIRR